MSLKIEVAVPFEMIHEDHAGVYLKSALSAIGYVPVSPSAPAPTGTLVVEVEDAPAAPAPVEEVAEKAPAKRGRKAKEADPEPEARNISANPENRVDPAQEEADTKQDAEDEAAEVEAKRDPKKPLTVEDVRNAMTAYVTAYGLPATQEDGPLIFTEALGAPPSGETYWKLSLLPDDQDKLQRVVDTWAKALEINPKKRARAAS